jgi:hypothetical protein
MDPNLPPRRQARYLTTTRDRRCIALSKEREVVGFGNERKQGRSSNPSQVSNADIALEEVKKLAARETSLANRWKALLLSVWLVGATGAAAGSYNLLSREEKANYTSAVS